jgi:GLPGLI family protein
MKHLSLIWIPALLGASSVYSQSKAVSGKIAYTATTRYSLYITGTADKTDTAFLYFNDTSSAYLIDVPRNIDTKKIAAQFGDVEPSVKEELLTKISNINNKLKVNFDYHRNNTSTISRQWLNPNGDAYCILDSIPDFNWQLLPDTMRILGFLCQKATCSILMGGSIRKFTAWYTPDIAASYGPSRFFGLPGLILMADNTYYNYTAVNIQIPIKTDEMVKLSPCKGLQTISKKQADEISTKMRTDMMNMQKLRTN